MTRRRLLSTVALLALLATPVAAAKAQIVKWSDAGGWRVAVDRADRSCFTSKTFSKGTTLLVMFNRPNKSFSMLLGNPAWTSITDKSEYSLRIVMDGAPWDGPFKGRANDGNPYLFADGLSQKFLADFMRRNSAAFYNATNGVHITSLPLAGSTIAMTELVECQRAMNGEES